MAKRPAWTIENGNVICKEFDFAWNGGFAVSQKRKNINALHQAIGAVTSQKALEISSKGEVELGNQLSAFNMKKDGIFIENIFQSSKKYENGGPYLDLLDALPKDAKRDERHHSSGKLVAFVKNGVEWALEPKTAFYDYIYVLTVIENFGCELDLSEYQWFTDIEFNPGKSINCQARAVAIYKLIQEKAAFDVLNNKEVWVEFHSKYVKA
jgi:hypothetical protein